MLDSLRPPTLVAAALLLGLQAVGLMTMAIGAARSAPAEPEPGEAEAVIGSVSVAPVVGFLVLAGLLVLVVGIGMWRRKRWSRGAAVAWSVLLVLVGLSQLGENLVVGLGVSAVALATAVCAVVSPTRLALEA